MNMFDFGNGWMRRSQPPMCAPCVPSWSRTWAISPKPLTTVASGPSGSGKSSLCEALEFALLGSVQEEDERSVRRYLDNVHEGRHVLPRLICEVNGKEHEMFPDEELHRFIIVERNRIEGFARMGARSSSAATKMLAMLFGIAPFNDFVSNFGASLETYLDLALPKATELKLKQAGTVEDQFKIASVKEAHEGFDERRGRVVEGFEPGLSYADLRAKIGTKEAPGRPFIPGWAGRLG
ncbi:hypothetical protein [Luteibacter sp. 22Crub2.1]|uniref:hypothetical protein n=1 Tax=Luteibacter sp. 22Crub2.1 TaxID=1283288 RepID=UPI0009A90B13|nr:hypothetical protein [Luteibacter sp. 22Crub2.1]SKB27847.1 hypothetical protein SAMN05660880_00293 [Luteibacter sp. 22Crub2.1]